MPLAACVGAFVLAILLAPEIDSPRAAGRYSSLFSTSAQVIVTLLVALALEVRSLPFPDVNARKLIAVGTLGYIVIGAVAAILALTPTLAACVYKLLFALTLGAGAGALLSVLTIAYYIFASEVRERRDSDTLPPRSSAGSALG